MYATDFFYNGHYASEFGLLICSYGGGNEDVADGGDIEFSTIKAPNNDSYNYFGGSFNEVLEWKFGVMKNTCKNNDLYFNQREESTVAKWLLQKKNYKWFQFDQEGYEDVYYKVLINAKPHQIGGKTVGFDITVTSNCGYGWSKEIEKKGTLTKNSPIKLELDNDLSDVYTLPEIMLIPKKNSVSLDLKNNADDTQPATKIKISSERTVVMDSVNDIIKGIDDYDKDFNWYFIKLKDGTNIISTTSDVEVDYEIRYRETRRVIV